MSVLLKNGLIVTQNGSRDIVRGNVYIEDDRIVEIGDVSVEAEYEIDCSSSIVMPGLINCHNHVANTLARGYADDLQLEGMLEKAFEFDKRVTKRDIQIASLLGCLEMIKSGTTTFMDMFYWEDEVARAVRECGMRAYLGWVLLDEELSTQSGTPLENCKAFIRKHKNEERIKPVVSLHGVYTCSEETFLAGKDIADRENLLCHFHLSETRKEVHDHVKKFGKRPPEWLESIGFLGENCIAAHCVWLTINEIRLLGKRGVKVVHCPVSNMKLASGGFAPVPEMLENGLTVSLGTDSPMSNNSLDLMQEMKICSIMHKASRWDASILKAQEVLDMATIGGAKALGREQDLGSVEEGKKADIIVADVSSPHCLPLTKDRVVSYLVYSSKGSDVRTSIVDGEILMNERRFTRVDEQAVMDRIQVLVKEIFPEES